MRIPILDGGREVSHLDVTLARPDSNRPDSSRADAGVGATPTASVLYLHGFGSSQNGEKADFFRARALAAGLGFWSFDFQGHGASGGGMGELTLSRCLADIERVRGAMVSAGETRIALLGSSMGGLAGLWHSARSPAGVEAGLYIAPALGLEQAFEAWAGEEGLARWQRDGAFEVTNELGSWEIGWGFVEDLRRYPNASLASSLATPSLLLQGKLDDRVAWRDVLDLSVNCRAPVELHLFSDGDHRLVDRKRHLWDLMIGFLRARGVLSP